MTRPTAVDKTLSVPAIAILVFEGFVFRIS
jgi:hypothetical protein